MRNLLVLRDECIKEIEASRVLREEDIDKIRNCKFKVNNRAKGRFGQCRYRGGVAFEININGMLLDEKLVTNEKEVKDTIIHEMFHAVYPYDGHKGMWKLKTQQFNKKAGYNIKRTGSYSNLGLTEEGLKSVDSGYKYKIVCPDCRREWRYKRKSKVVANLSACACPYCKITGALELVNL